MRRHWNIAAAIAAKTTHGESIGGPSTEFTIWFQMLERCHNPRCRAYRWYGARGIEVCDRWRQSLVNFIADMGRRPSPKHTLDRIDNGGNYEPGNCRWATRLMQMNNTRSNRRQTYHGRTQTMADWARELGINYKALHRRLAAGWTIEEAFTKPRDYRLSSRRLEYEGRTQTLAEWAKEIGMGPSTLYERLQHGWSIEDALTKKLRFNHGARRLEHNGKVQTIAEWAKDLGMTPGSLNERLRAGWTIAEAVTRPRRDI